MNLKRYSGMGLLILMLSMTTMACSLFRFGSDGPPSNAAVVEVMANTALTPWLETAVADFNEAGLENSSGDPYFAILTSVDAGEGVTQIIDGIAPGLWIPDDTVWVNLLAQQGNSGYQANCVSVAESPLVIGMWREVAQSLGWPGLPIGWLDIGSLAADPAAWNYYSGGDFGNSFRLGHTHPGLSGSGASTLLALVQAAESKTEAVTPSDVAQPIVQASVGAFESGVSTFSSSTALLGQTMSERGLTYLAAGIMYESTVLQYGNGEIVPVYPLEGTFIATHPACVNGNASSEVQDAAVAFRDYLIGEAAQQTAVGNGLRPVNDAVAIGPPLTEANGVDLSQPATIFNAASVDSVFAVQELWQEARKDVNLVMLLDTSGSMRGSKMDNMLEAAVQFVGQMGDDDYLSLIAFSTEPALIINHERVGDSREKIITTIERLRAEGDTTLFDAIGDGSSVIASTTSVDTTNALVVLTDGQDTRSYRFDATSAAQAALTNDTTIFTIAYGGDADESTLAFLATEANGNFYSGDAASIAAIYEEMSAAFGGSVGVGR